MDLGISGRTALVAASSAGLGFAIADALASEGVHVVINGRNDARLQAAADALRERHDVTVTAVRADLDRPDGRASLIEACPSPDILVTNNGGPAPTPFAETTPERWEAALQAQLLGAVELIQAALPGMRARGFGRIVNITSAMVTSPHPMMTLSTVPRAGLTALAKALSREVAADGVTVNNLLPERIDTNRQKFMMERMAAESGETPDAVRARVTAALPARRFGRPEEFAATAAFICSAHAGFLTGQNLHLDGGSYEGLI